MTIKQKDFTKHFKLARRKTRELGYDSMLHMDREGTVEHKQLIQNIYLQPIVEINLNEAGK